jgi:hypothetical protein
MRSPLLLPVPLLLLALAAGGEEGKAAIAPLPAGKTRVFEAIVIEVAGTAQARTKPDAPWKQLAVNDKVAAGTVIRTGRASHVALRVGPNATMLVEHQTRVAIPEIVQDGATLRTRVSMAFGKTDVRVDRIGLTNDFEVATPTATLAVRGTVFRIGWDAVSGYSAVGVPNNKLRAIELKYVEGTKAYLSHADQTNEMYKPPSIASFYETYFLPLEGAIGEDELEDPTQTPPDALKDPRTNPKLGAAAQSRIGGQEPGGQNPAGQPVTGAPQHEPPPEDKGDR